MHVVLISTYELGHQPFGLASPAAWLREVGAEVTCFDFAVQPSNTPQVRQALANADLVAFYLPMHTATRIAAPLIKQVKLNNPAAHVCCYGLYAPVNEAYLRELGADTILGGEFEQGLADLHHRLASGDGPAQSKTQPEPRISLAKQTFRAPDRSGLPQLSRYARLTLGNDVQHVAGYVEASRGCKHRCRHCPIVPVYEGRFRIVQRAVVLDDVRQQVAAGAQHITFGDPDFFNGPGHAIPLVQALHEQFPELTYDVTIKVEHLLKHAHYLPILRDTGCLFVTSAVEALDDEILAIFDKRHTRGDFLRAVQLLREVGLALNPTFVAFTPWTSRRTYQEFLAAIAELDLIENVAPIQYAIRLLIPAGSKLLELPQVRQLVERFDEAGLCYRWTHPDPQMDQLQADVLSAVQMGQAAGDPRHAIFQRVWKLAYGHDTGAQDSLPGWIPLHAPSRPIPHLSEPWYC